MTTRYVNFTDQVQKLNVRFVFVKTCEANPAGENRSFIFTVGVKSVPLYHFKLAHLVLHMAVKEVFETHSYK